MRECEKERFKDGGRERERETERERQELINWRVKDGGRERETERERQELVTQKASFGLHLLRCSFDCLKRKHHAPAPYLNHVVPSLRVARTVRCNRGNRDRCDRRPAFILKR